MIFLPAIPQQQAGERLVFYREVLAEAIRRCERRRLPLRIPRSSHLYERHPGMAYHFKPEIFLQTGGCTQFRCPNETYLLRDQELSVMPTGLPHAEEALDQPGQSFQNVVVCFYNQTTTIHMAERDASGRPQAQDIFFIRSDHYGVLVQMLDTLCQTAHLPLPGTPAVEQSLTQAVLALLLNQLHLEVAGSVPDSQKVFRCQWLIRMGINDPELSVKGLAEELQCTPNYLSRIFQEQTGERLSQYILNRRLRNAAKALRDTAMSVKEIAWAAGFHDPNYFSRIFRKSFGKTPQDYRTLDAGKQSTLEGQPKTVYADREAYDFELDWSRDTV